MPEMSKNPNLTDETNGFKLVSYKKRSCKFKNSCNKTPAQEIESSDYHIDVPAAVRRIHIAHQEFLASSVYTSFKALLTEGLALVQNPKVQKIICLGLGSIGESIISRYQLAFLLYLKDRFNTTVQIYDPIITECEQQILNEFGCEILRDNAEGKYSVERSSATIFYLPHCPKQLSNNLLWKNWGLQLSNCILISNSFYKIVESNTSKYLRDNANFIASILPHTTELAVVNEFKFYEIFNDTSIHIFPCNKLSLLPEDFWEFNSSEPVYDNQDIEFISGKLDQMINNIKMSLSPNISILRQIISELRRGIPHGNFKDHLSLRYIYAQFRKYQTTDQQLCKAQEEMKFVAHTYLCYLKSSRLHNEICEEFHGKGERTIRETANLVGFKLPHDPK